MATTHPLTRRLFNSLSQIYLAGRIENKALCFLVYEMLLDRVALLLSYPHADAIDVGEYGEEAGRASSAFLWDMHHLTTGIDQMRAAAAGAPPPDPKWTTLIEQTATSRAEWLVRMVIGQCFVLASANSVGGSLTLPPGTKLRRETICPNSTRCIFWTA